MAKIGINVRSSSGYVTDSVDQDYSLGGTGARSLNGFSHAWSSDATGASRDRSTSATFAPELSGIIFQSNATGSTVDLVVTLPAAGDYKVGLAIGDASSSQAGQTVKVLDGSTTLLTVCTTATSTSGNFLDVTGTSRTPAQWKAERTTTTLTFATTTLRVRLGGGGAAGANTTLAHLYVEQAASGGSASLASIATLAATGTATAAGSAAPSATATLSAAGAASALGSAALASVATLAAAGSGAASGAATFASVATLTASGGSGGGAALTSVATLAAAGTATAAGSVTLASVATISAAGSVPGFAAAINFRATAGYVTDGAGQTYSLGAVYPTVRGGLTFGWDANDTGQARDRTTLNDPRLCGMLFASTAGGVVRTFRLDLPAPGTYDVRLAMGDPSSGTFWAHASVLDGSTPLLTIASTTSQGPGNSFFDAGYQPGDAPWSAAAWPGSNRAARLTFSGTVLNLAIGSAGFSGNDTCLAHLSATQVAGGGPVSGSATLAAAATLSAAGAARASGTAALASAATLAPAGSAAASGSAALASVAILAAAGGTGGGAALGGVATLAASGTAAAAGSAAPASAATLAAAGTATAAGTAALASVATLAAAGAGAFSGASDLASVATLAVAGTATAAGSAALRSVAILAVAAAAGPAGPGVLGNRDWDIVLDIQARLDATGAFADVRLCVAPENRTPVAVVDQAEFDEDLLGVGDELIRTVRPVVSLLSRSFLPEDRMAELSRLSSVVQDAVDGQSLAGLTVPGMTRTLKGTFATKGQETTLTMKMEAAYIVPGPAGHDAAER